MGVGKTVSCEIYSCEECPFLDQKGSYCFTLEKVIKDVGTFDEECPF